MLESIRSGEYESVLTQVEAKPEITRSIEEQAALAMALRSLGRNEEAINAVSKNEGLFNEHYWGKTKFQAIRALLLSESGDRSQADAALRELVDDLWGIEE